MGPESGSPSHRSGVARVNDLDAHVMRTAVIGRVGSSGTPPSTLFVAPGRAALECAVAFSSLSLLEPVLVCFAAPAAVIGRRRGNGRATAALVASFWCAFLGLLLRGALGLGVLP